MNIFRYQNFCFLLMAALMGSTLLCDFCYTEVLMTSEPGITARVSVSFTDNFAFAALSAVSVLAAVAGIAACRRQDIQLRLAVFTAVILLAYQIWIGVEFFRMNGAYVFTLAALWPLVSLAADILAIRFILKDISQDAAHDLYASLRRASLTGNKPTKK